MRGMSRVHRMLRFVLAVVLASAALAHAADRGPTVFVDEMTSPELAAHVEEPTSGRAMDVWTTEPGVQLFTGNRFDGTLAGVGGVALVRHAGFSLETQHFPDAINHPAFPSVVLRPGQTFHSTTIYRFSVAPRPASSRRTAPQSGRESRESGR